MECKFYDSPCIFDHAKGCDVSEFSSDSKRVEHKYNSDSDNPVYKDIDIEYEMCKSMGKISLNQQMIDGFRISSIVMRDGSSGRIIWQSSHWGDDMFSRTHNGNFCFEKL